MATPFLQPAPRNAPGPEWAVRLIPGAATTRKKRPQRELGSALFQNPRPSFVQSADVPAPLRILRRPTVLARTMQNVLIIGSGKLTRRIERHLQNHPELGRCVRAVISDCGNFDRPCPAGDIHNLAHLARTEFIDEIILAAPQDRDLVARVLRTARRLRLNVKFAPQLFGCESALKMEYIGGIPLISLHQEHLPIAGLWAKRALDLTVAALALVFVSPLLALIAVLIRLDSSGPVLYAAPRAGRKGRPFPCYKFRTMVSNADELKERLRQQNERQGPFFKIARDPRITRFGRFLRRYSLDELPQLWNVLGGDMSLVGPRPHPLDDFSSYAIEHLPRLDVTPGMTGLWQVTARRNPSFQTGVDLDIEYIRLWSLRMDLRILWKTAGIVLRGSGQ
jgi:exopolysaccharide biosynthesis polyprenyl glycosylphosphotransferase